MEDLGTFSRETVGHCKHTVMSHHLSSSLEDSSAQSNVNDKDPSSRGLTEESYLLSALVLRIYQRLN